MRMGDDYRVCSKFAAREDEAYNSLETARNDSKTRRTGNMSPATE